MHRETRRRSSGATRRGARAPPPPRRRTRRVRDASRDCVGELNLNLTERDASVRPTHHPRRADETVVAVDDDATTPARVVAKEITLLERGDLVDLAWSWLARATLCASSVRTDIMRQCDVEPTVTYSGDATFGDATNRVTVDALVNGCCAAVAAHADAGCACALEVAEGLAPFDYTSARAPSAMARSDAVHAAVATLEALCFGEGRHRTNARDAYDERARAPPRQKNRRRARVVGDARGDARRRARGRPPRDTSKVPRTPPRARSPRRRRRPRGRPRKKVRRGPARHRRRRERRRRDLGRFERSRAEVTRA